MPLDGGDDGGNHRKARAPPDGVGGGGRPGDDGPGGGGGNGRSAASRRPLRCIAEVDSEREGARKKEAETVLLQYLPKTAAEYRPWLDHNGVDFDTFGRIPPKLTSLDARLRAALAKHTVGKDPGSASLLIS